MAAQPVEALVDEEDPCADRAELSKANPSVSTSVCPSVDLQDPSIFSQLLISHASPLSKYPKKTKKKKNLTAAPAIVQSSRPMLLITLIRTYMRRATQVTARAITTVWMPRIWGRWLSLASLPSAAAMAVRFGETLSKTKPSSCVPSSPFSRGGADRIRNS